MGTGAYIAEAVSAACVVILFVMGNRIVRATLALLVLVALGGYALLIAYASGRLADLFG